MSLERPPFPGRPPIGEVRDLNKEQAERTLAVEFVSIEERPELPEAFDCMAEHVNGLRGQVGLSELSFSYDEVRLIPSATWKDMLRISGLTQDAGGFWDPLTKKAYLNYPAEDCERSRTSRIHLAYTMAHELAHKATPNAPYYSYDLSEGLADTIAQDAIEYGGLIQEYRGNLGKRVREEEQFEDGFKLHVSDILVEESGQIVPYGRTAQRRLIEVMKRSKGPTTFVALLEVAMTGSADEVKEVVRANYGEALAEVLNGRQRASDMHEVIRLLRP